MVLSGAHAARPAPLVFGDSPHWYLLDVTSKKVRPLGVDFGSTVPIEVTTGNDGAPIVFTARDEKAGNVLLFRWDPMAKRAVSIGDVRGYHSQPVLSDDGKWVYFSHNPDAGGPPGEHQAQAYAQLYRVHLDGTGLEALSHEDGCHFDVHRAGRGRVAVVHSDCRTREELQFYAGKRARVQHLPGFPDRFQELAIAPDGHTTLRVAKSVDSFSFYLSDGKHPASRILHLRRYGSVTHAAFGAESDTFYFQNGTALWQFSRGQLTQLVNLK